MGHFSTLLLSTIVIFLVVLILLIEPILFQHNITDLHLYIDFGINHERHPHLSVVGI